MLSRRRPRNLSAAVSLHRRTCQSPCGRLPAAPGARPLRDGLRRRRPARVPSRATPSPRNSARPQFVPGLTTTVAGYNGIFPGPTIRAKQGTRIEVRIRNALPGSRALLQPGASIPPPTCTARRRCPSTTATPTTSPSPGIRQELPLPQLAAGADALVPRPQAPHHRPERVFGTGRVLPDVRPVRAGPAAARRVRRAADDFGRDVQGRRLARRTTTTATKGCGATSSWSTGCRGPP